MEKSDFKADTRYTVTWNDNGKLRPANIYTYVLRDDYMIVRMTDKDGLLRKIKYDDITRIVKTKEVPEQERYMIPDIVLDEKVWANRDVMQRYSTSPQMGK